MIIATIHVTNGDEEALLNVFNEIVTPQIGKLYCFISSFYSEVSHVKQKHTMSEHIKILVLSECLA